MAELKHAITFVDDHAELRDTLDGMLSSCYKKRMQAEYQQLVIRIRKLNQIIKDYQEGCLDFELPYDPFWLVRQRNQMESYKETLRHIMIEDVKQGMCTEDEADSEGGT